MPPPLLDEAAKLWARDNKWMPRASELRDLAKTIRSTQARGSDFAGQQLQEHCDTLNAYGFVQASGDPYVVGTFGGVRQVMRRSHVRKAA